MHVQLIHYPFWQWSQMMCDLSDMIDNTGTVMRLSSLHPTYPRPETSVD